jgi:hypothetical protein
VSAIARHIAATSLPRLLSPSPSPSVSVPSTVSFLCDFAAQTPMALVMFMDAIQHVARIARVLRQV